MKYTKGEQIHNGDFMTDQNENPLKNKSVLITGGTGSLGKALAKRLIEEDLCRRVIIFSRDEWKQWEMQQNTEAFRSPKMRYFLGDVRDLPRLTRAFNDVQVVVHAAALKQVPAAEYNPTEFIKTNINGAMNVVDAAIENNVERVIALSTDKAVNPVNLYGASKLCSDKLFVAASSYVGRGKHTIFSVVRYGNVLGSRGSIIPLWRKMANEGVTSLPLTDDRMTRFWITIDQAVDFILNNFRRMRGGEIYIPKIPSMKIVDLVDAIAPGKPYHIIGIRPGEKLHELMVGEDDGRHTVEYSDHFMIIPEAIATKPELVDAYLRGRLEKRLHDGFTYTSLNNPLWINKEELKAIVEPYLKET